MVSTAKQGLDGVHHKTGSGWCPPQNRVWMVSTTKRGLGMSVGGLSVDGVHRKTGVWTVSTTKQGVDMSVDRPATVWCWLSPKALVAVRVISSWFGGRLPRETFGTMQSGERQALGQCSTERCTLGQCSTERCTLGQCSADTDFGTMQRRNTDLGQCSADTDLRQ